MNAVLLSFKIACKSSVILCCQVNNVCLCFPLAAFKIFLSLLLVLRNLIYNVFVLFFFMFQVLRFGWVLWMHNFIDCIKFRNFWCDFILKKLHLWGSHSVTYSSPVIYPLNLNLFFFFPGMTTQPPQQGSLMGSSTVCFF